MSSNAGAASPKIVYQRVLLKLSGEALAGEQKTGIKPEVIRTIAQGVAQAHSLGVQMGVVIGGGNIFRGIAAAAQGMDRVNSDYMGMLATVINALALQEAFEKAGVPTRVQTAIAMSQLAEPYIRRRAIRHFEKGRVVIFAGGTGNPYFTTDTAAALRAVEMEAHVILKATKVDGIYERDPVNFPEAKKFDEITYLDVLNRGLKVMDSTAISLCMDNKIPIITFNISNPDHIKRVICGENIGTIVK